MRKHNNIVFTNTLNAPEEYAPKPAFQLVPDWYKETESYLGGKKTPDGSGVSSGTIKRCMPVFDAINSGYYLVTHTDIWVKQIAQNPEKPDEKTPYYEWPSSNPIAFHPIEQAPVHPNATGTPIPKWINPWGIKTPKGYSTLFIAPVHRDNPFVAMAGVVDTDAYTAPVNIIFTLANPTFEGLVPAGTPIVQIIPFKRDEWKMLIGNQEDLIEQNKVTNKLRSKFFDSYKSLFRANKEYR